MLWLHAMHAYEQGLRLLQVDGFRARAQYASIGSTVAERTGSCCCRAHRNARNGSVSSCTFGDGWSSATFASGSLHASRLPPDL